MTTNPPTPPFGGTPDIGRLDPSTLGHGALLRAMADGEVQPLDTDALRQRIPDYHQRIEFERSLRSAIAGAMGADQSAPATVRASVEALLRSSGSEQADAPAPLPFVNTRRIHLNHRLTSVAALAAVLALSAGMLYLAGGQMWRGSQAPSNPLTGGSTLLSAGLGQQVQRQHHSTAEMGPNAKATFEARTTDEAAAAAERTFHGVPQSIRDGIARLEHDGYTFLGFGPTKLPVKGTAAHLIYKSAQTGACVSLFILADAGCIKLEDGGCCVRSNELGDQRGTIVAWREGRFNYLIYSCCPDALDDAKQAFSAPVPERPER